MLFHGPISRVLIGHVIDSAGLHPRRAKVKAITKAPAVQHPEM